MQDNKVSVFPPTCDMVEGCKEPITMLDSAGFVYCTRHGLERRTYEPCRKLRPYELRAVLRGDMVKRY